MTAVRARWKLVAVGIVALAVAAVVLSLTAWSSSGSGASDAPANDAEQAMLDFAQCMRDNGVPSFPDPVARPDGSFGFERPQGVPQSALDDALGRCQVEAQAIGIGPGSVAQDPEVQDGLLRFARCMRKNGIPEFPDPKPNSDLISGLHGMFSNIDPESPRVQRAMLKGCQSILNQLFGTAHGGG